MLFSIFNFVFGYVNCESSQEQPNAMARRESFNLRSIILITMIFDDRLKLYIFYFASFLSECGEGTQVIVNTEGNIKPSRKSSWLLSLGKLFCKKQWFNYVLEGRYLATNGTAILKWSLAQKYLFFEKFSFFCRKYFCKLNLYIISSRLCFQFC